MEIQIGAATMEDSIGASLENQSYHMTCDPAIPLLGMYLEKTLI